MSDDITHELRKSATCIHIAADESVATALAHTLRAGADEIDRLRDRLEQAEELLDEAEPDVWATCGCEPKKPNWWGSGDQSELRPYENRAAERTRRCYFHKRYDAFLRGESDD